MHCRKCPTLIFALTFSNISVALFVVCKSNINFSSHASNHCFIWYWEFQPISNYFLWQQFLVESDNQIQLYIIMRSESLTSSKKLAILVLTIIAFRNLLSFGPLLCIFPSYRKSMFLSFIWGTKKLYCSIYWRRHGREECNLLRQLSHLMWTFYNIFDCWRGGILMYSQKRREKMDTPSGNKQLPFVIYVQATQLWFIDI